MQIDKQQIIDLLQQNGKQNEAQEAQNSLPDQVNPMEHAGMLEKFGLNPADLLSKFGGGDGGGIAGKLGGMLGGK